MSDTVRYGGLDFNRSLLFAQCGDRILRFTRQERALLSFFTSNPNRLLTRQQLLGTLVSGHGESLDRNIDYLVNRLRTKLNDNAREPRFIATQYGEGYVWIAEPQGSTPENAFLIVGPVFGMAALGDGTPANVFMRLLAEALSRLLSPNRQAVLAPDWQFDPARAGNACFHVEIGFHERNGSVHAAILLRDLPAQGILHSIRLVIDRDEERAVDDLAKLLQARLWSHLAQGDLARPSLRTEPLALRIHNAGLLLGRGDQSWVEAEAQITRARHENPSDPHIQVMWATHLANRMILAGQPLTDCERDAMEDEIEEQAFLALPHIHKDTMLTLAVAKLLMQVNRGHFSLAEELAERAFSESVAFAASLSLLGQLRMFRGNLDEACTLFDRGIELADKGSEFHIFLIVLKCIAFAAGGRREELDETLASLVYREHEKRIRLGLLFAPERPAKLDAEHMALLLAGGVDAARSILSYVHSTAARYFHLPEHRLNVLRGPASQFMGRFGPVVLTERLKREVPGLTALAEPPASEQMGTPSMAEG